MKIELHQVGKKFRKQFVFKNLTCTINSGEKWVILGENGSGKSTLLKVISGAVAPSVGQINYFNSGGPNPIEITDLPQFIGMATPYMDLIEEFSPIEILEFIKGFKSFEGNATTQELIDLVYLGPSKNKPIKYFSSGMKQRLKLLIALTTKNSLVLLDEPTSNLDSKGIAWYKELVNTYANEKTIVVCSNALSYEYEFCTQQINIEDYK